jgi:hypothetical protein
MRALSAIFLTAALVAPHSVLAQNSLSVQGLGYPASGLSTRALTLGGATGEIDPVSALNPAALASWGASGVAAHMAPERRSLRGPDDRGTNTIVRFPLYASGIEVNSRFTLGVSSSTLLDESWSTRSEAVQVVNGQDIMSTSLRTNLGAINDLRFAAAYRLSSSLQVGLGGHLITGSKSVSIFTDYAAGDIADINVRTELGYSGSAFSAGVTWRPMTELLVATSARLGGRLSTTRDGVEAGSASVPDRAGATLAYLGPAGSLLAVRYEVVSFSQMSSLNAQAGEAIDTRDIGLGLEMGGPSIFRNPSTLLLGARRRDLPFAAAGAKVMETSISAGLGLSLASGAASFDLGVVRVLRDNNSAFRESAWLIATGFQIKPRPVR